MSEPSATDAPTSEEEAPEPLNFTLQVISTAAAPTSGPLSFPHLPATTTIKQLKAKIRDALPSKPVDEHQRLIYRGRLLARETDTMLDIFGQETLASAEPQNMHLVLRPIAPDANTPLAIPNAVAEAQLRNNLIPATFPPRPQSTPLNQIHGMRAQQPLPGFQHVHQHHILPNNDIINGQAQRLQQIQRETSHLNHEIAILQDRLRSLAQPTATLHAQHPLAHTVLGATNVFQLPQRQFPPMPPQFQTLIQQQQRERAAQGLHGAQDIPGTVPPSLSAPGSGRASPNIHRPEHIITHTRDAIGPHGQRYHITETTTAQVQTGVMHMGPDGHYQYSPIGPQQAPVQINPFAQHQPFPQQPNPVLEIQAILRNADRLNAQNHMQRSASNPTRRATSTPGTSRGSPNSVPAAVNAPLINNIPHPFSIPIAANARPTVTLPNTMLPNYSTAYILSSPSGPQALLVSNSGSFWSPQQPSGHHSIDNNTSDNNLGQAGAAAALPEFRNRHGNRAARRAQRNGQNNAPEPLNPVHANPRAGALAAQIGPMIWLIVRLAGFVWFFTSGNTSWTRFIIIVGLALLLFIANTGVFNGFAEQVWGPIRRHLEGLIPLAGPDAALVPAANAAVVAQPEPPAGGDTEQPDPNPGLRQRRGASEPDPAEAAARIIAQRRQNQGWLFTQFRRAEHALLLFVASLVPGVGERHIAAREAEATAAEAERQRQIEPTTAAETAPNNENGEGEPTDDRGNATNGGAEAAGANEAADRADHPVEA